MTHKEKISKFIEDRYGYSVDFGIHDSIVRKKNKLIWVYPGPAGIMYRATYSLNKKMNIKDEISFEEKSVMLNEHRYKPFSG